VKSLLDPTHRAAILARLDALDPDAHKRWGRMSVGGMLCHLTDAFLAVLGERGPRGTPKLHERTVMRWVALSTPVPWPKGVPTMAVCDQEKDGTPPSDFEHDKQTLRDATERFLGAIDGENLFHPIFGRMSVGEWGRWGYRHMDHHLRQFSA
jgi:hypothetical protein